MTSKDIISAAFGILLFMSVSAANSDDLPHVLGSDLEDDSNVIVLVETEEAANRLIVNASRGDYQLNSKKALFSLGLIALDFERPKGVSGRLAVADMKRMEPGAAAGVDSLYRVQAQDPVRARHFAGQILDWPQKGCQAHSPVGMIDDGIDHLSQSLGGAILTYRNFSDGPEARPHGTAIASLLVGPGRLTNAHLYSANVVGQENRGAGLFELIAAIDWMQSMEVPVVNISLAGPNNPVLEKAVGRTLKTGMLIVAAVGNDGPTSPALYPAAYDGVIAVTAIDSTFDVYDKAVQGAHVDFAAPGVDVFVPDQGYLTGTSIAAPFVTAAIVSDSDVTRFTSAALVKRAVVYAALDLGSPGHDNVFGAGLLRSSQTCEANF